MATGIIITGTYLLGPSWPSRPRSSRLWSGLVPLSVALLAQVTRFPPRPVHALGRVIGVICRIGGFAAGLSPEYVARRIEEP